MVAARLAGDIAEPGRAMPRFWIVAGPNGSGKSTLVESGIVGPLLGANLVLLNADVLTREILDADPAVKDANLRAAVEIDDRVAAFIEQGVDFLVETVLSSDKYIDDIDRALSLGFEVGLIYVCLQTPAASIRRVASRTEMGGHDVPEDRIVARWGRSIEMLGRIAPKMHLLYVFDNSRRYEPVLLVSKQAGKLVFHAPGRIPEIDAVLSGPEGTG